MSGLECIRLLRQELPHLQVIALSHFHHPDQLFDALKAGVLACVLKPVIPTVWNWNPQYAFPVRGTGQFQATNCQNTWSIPVIQHSIFLDMLGLCSH